MFTMNTDTMKTACNTAGRLLLLASLLWGASLRGQVYPPGLPLYKDDWLMKKRPEMNCSGAIEVCNGLFDFPLWYWFIPPAVQDYCPADPTFFPVANTPCDEDGPPQPNWSYGTWQDSTYLAGNHNHSMHNMWLSARVVSDGDFCFTITPYDTLDWYNWVVFRLPPGYDCEDLSQQDYAEIVKWDRTTSIIPLNPPFMNSTCVGVTGLSLSPPNTPTCTAFDSCLQVQAGERILIQISAIRPLVWCNNPNNFNICTGHFQNLGGTGGQGYHLWPNGLQIDFSESTAFFGDTLGARVVRRDTMALTCGATLLPVRLTHALPSCTQVPAGTFSLLGPGGQSIPISGGSSPVCYQGPPITAYADSFLLSLSSPLSQPGTYQLIQSATLAGSCFTGQTIDTMTFYLELDLPDAGPDTSVAFCVGNGLPRPMAIALPPGLTGGNWLDPQGQPHSGMWDPLTDLPGPYQYVMGGPGCALSDTAQILVQGVPTQAGQDTFATACVDPLVPFNLNDYLTASADTGGRWLTVSGFPVGSTGNLSPISQGTYTFQYVTGGDLGHQICTADTALIVIDALGAPYALFTKDNVTCYGGSDGSVTVNFTFIGGGPPYQYSVDGGPFQTAPGLPFTVGGLTAGPHEIEYMGSTGCINRSTFVLNEPPASTQVLIQGVTVSPESCPGAGDGSIQVQAAGGTFTPYQYALGGGPFQMSNTFSGLSAGTYSLTVVDYYFCPRDTVVSVGLLPPLQVTAQVTSSYNGFAVSCAGSSDGSVLALGSGGAGGGYSYSWNSSPSQNGDSLTGLPAGTYTVTLTDANGCSSQASLSLSAPPPLGGSTAIASSYNGQAISCVGASDGALTAQGSGGVGPYTYLWNGGPATATASGLGAGTYQVLVTDANGCTASLSGNLSDPPPLSATSLAPLLYNGYAVGCDQGSNGQAQAQGNGGTGPYSYLWSDGQSTATASGLGVGTYQVLVTDANGCTTLDSVSLSAPPAVQIGAVSSLAARCAGESNGSLSLAPASGGVGGYTYALDGGPFGPGTSFPGLGAGSYTLIVRDANLCPDSLIATVAEPAPLLIGLDSMAEVDCFGNHNGLLYPSAQGGTAAYSYSLDGGPFGPGPFASLGVGYYQIRVEDIQGCRDSLTAQVTGPLALFTQVDSVIGARCYGEANGRLVVSTSGGIAPYLWSSDGLTYGPQPLLEDLAAGPQTVYTQDANGCIITIGATMSEPDSLTLALVQQQDPSCYGLDDGWASLQAQGGTPGYLYAGGDSLFAPNPVGGLSAGADTLYAQDSQGCLARVTVLLDQPDSLEVFATVSSDYQGRDLSCTGAADGAAIGAASGGTGPYSYSWDQGSLDSTANSLSAGSYALTVTDAQGCVGMASVSLIDPPLLAVSALPRSDYQGWGISCFGAADGRLGAEASGGTPGYGYSWSDGQSGPVAGDLPAGSYVVTATDTNGCVARDTLAVSSPPPLETWLEGRDVACHGGADGRIWAQVSGGTPPYRGRWPGQGTGFSLDGLPIGTYTFIVEDTNGCADTAMASLAQPAPLGVELSTQEAYCNWPTGEIAARVGGGTPPYAYRWDSEPPQLSALATGLPEGLYQVVVTDAQGCRDSLAAFVAHVPPPVADFVILAPDSSGPVLLSQAEIHLRARTQGALSYQWDLGDGSPLRDGPNPVHRYTEPGRYEILLAVYHQYPQCPDTARRVVEIIPDGALYLPNAFSPNGDGHNDRFRIRGEGYHQAELRIYDRWGRLAYRSQDLSQGWDGRYPGGQAAPEGVYALVLTASLFNGTRFERSGSVTLVR